MQPRACAATLVAAVLAAAAPPPAHADEVDYFAGTPDSGSVTVRREKSRTASQRLHIGGAIALGAVAAAVGVYFHLESRDAADAVSGDGELEGDAWTADRQSTYDRARQTGSYAGIGYGVAAVSLIGAAVIGWFTRPGDEELVITPGEPRATPVVAPVPGGAVVGGTWRW